jgi:hypothetical protein
MSCSQGCCRSAPRRVSFPMSNLIRSICVANSCSWLTGGHGAGGRGALAHEACPRPRAINSFASLDSYISPIEYDVSLHKVNTM